MDHRVIQNSFMVLAVNPATKKVELYSISKPNLIKARLGDKFYYEYCEFKKKFILKTIAPYVINQVYCLLEENTEEEGKNNTWTVPGHEGCSWIIGA